MNGDVVIKESTGVDLWNSAEDGILSELVFYVRRTLFAVVVSLLLVTCPASVAMSMSTFLFTLMQTGHNNIHEQEQRHDYVRKHVHLHKNRFLYIYIQINIDMDMNRSLYIYLNVQCIYVNIEIDMEVV